MVCIAYTGSGVTIFRLTDLTTAIQEYGMEAPCGDLVTADGNPLQGLCGQTAAEMRFAEGSKVHTVTTQVMDKKHMTPILGMDFWQPHNAVFDIKRNTITIESEEEDGSLTVEEITCCCEKDTKRAQAAVALQAQIHDLHKAHSWVSDSMQQQTLAGDGQDCAARQVSACQLSEIADTIAELQG